MASTSLTRADIDGLARKLFKYLAEDDEQWLSRLRLWMTRLPLRLGA